MTKIFLVLFVYVLVITIVARSAIGSQENKEGDHHVDIMTPEELKEHVQALQFLGTYNGKSWYLDRVNSTQGIADTGCTSMGLRLAMFGIQAEMQWIVNMTTTAETYIWTAGMSWDKREAFFWAYNGGGDISTSVEFFGYDHPALGLLGLVLGRSDVTLVSYTRSFLAPYLCSG